MPAVGMHSQECDRIKQRAVIPHADDQLVAAAEKDDVQILGFSGRERMAHDIAGNLLRADGKAAYSGAGFSGVAYDNDVKKAGLNAWGATISGSTITYEYEIKAYNEKIAKDAKIGFEIDVQDQSKASGSTISYSDATKSTDAKKFGYITLSGDKVSLPKGTAAATQKAPASSGSSAATFDGGIVIAALAAVSAAGVVVSKKRK